MTDCDKLSAKEWRKLQCPISWTNTRRAFIHAVYRVKCLPWQTPYQVDEPLSTNTSADLDTTITAAHIDFSEQKKISPRTAASEKGEDAQRRRTRSLRSKPDHDSRRKVAGARAVSALARLVYALGEEGIRFQIVGMSAAILQGVPATTLDTDFWVELPERQFVRLYAIIKELSGSMLAPTVAALSDDSIVNFLPRVDGLRDFARDTRKRLA